MNEKSAESLTVTVGAVRTRAGYVGQVMVGNVIVWEAESTWYDESQALEDARYRVIDKLGELLRQPTEFDAALDETAVPQ